MENASKALLMTGSILIGVILLSLGVYLYRSMSEFQSVQSSTFTEEQLTQYNLEFLSYDKKVMYGTDVITVLNKAIDSNKKYAEDDEFNFIDIGFKLKDSVSAVTTEYTWNSKTKRYDSKTLKTPVTGKTYSFETGKLYQLSNKEQLKMITDFLATSKEKTAIKNPNNPKPEEDYTITYTGFSDFKRMIFKCTKVEKNDVGKVCYMEFEQIESSTYNTDE